MRARWIGTMIVALCGAAQAQAAPATGSAERVLRSLGECRALVGDAAKLACFEKATAALETAVRARDVTIVDRQDVRTARRSLFGFTLPKIDLFGGGGGGGRVDAKEDAFTEINTTVASARPVANGRAEIRLADDSGAVWQTTDPMAFPPRAGDKIRIREGTLGNYFIATGGRSYRGMRLR